MSAEIRTALLQEVPDHGDSDDLARFAYYALFLHDAKLALSFASSAIALNPGSPLDWLRGGWRRGRRRRQW